MAESTRGTGDCDNGAAAAGRQARGRGAGTGRRRGGATQPWANVALSLTQRAALPDNVADVTSPSCLSILPERQLR